MRTLSTIAAAVAVTGAALVSTAHAAGTVDVVFVKPDEFADAGRGSVEIGRTTQVLADHLKQLGSQLPDGQTLRVEVLDVDLAGELKPTRARGDLRVLRGGADWPRMTVRYTLTGANGAALRSGEERLTDMNYLWGLRGFRAEEPLAHDRRMIDRWFAERFVPQRTAAVR